MLGLFVNNRAESRVFSDLNANGIPIRDQNYHLFFIWLEHNNPICGKNNINFIWLSCNLIVEIQI